MITLQGYLTQHAKMDDVPASVIENGTDLVPKANALLAHAAAAGVECAADPVQNSGYRPPGVNAGVPNASVTSKHMTGQAIDIADPEGELDAWCMSNLDQLEALGLWMEHPASTKGWCHVQTIAPRSGNRVFYP